MLESAEADGFPAFLLTYGKSRGKESRFRLTADTLE